MIDDSIISMVAIGLTLLILGLINGYQYADKTLPAGSLPTLKGGLSENSDGTLQTPAIQPGTILSTAATATTAALSPLAKWASSLGHEHPLVGRIWDAAHKEFVLPGDVAAAAAGADVLMVGETHDNFDHHKLQAWLVNELAHRGKREAVVMEMIGADKGETLASYQAGSGATAEGLGPALDWEHSNWPAWAYYLPVADAAFGDGYKIVPGDPSPAQVSLVRDQGVKGLTDAERERLSLSAGLPPRLGAALSDTLKSSHCGTLSDADVARMSDVQRYRDATLADNVLKAVQRNGSAMLVAGDGHVRTDSGAPYYLRLRAPNLKTVTIQLVEVQTGVENPDYAVSHDPDGKPAADFVWFTARADRADPCAALAKPGQSSTGAG